MTVRVAMLAGLAVAALAVALVAGYGAARAAGAPLPLLTHFLNERTGLYDRRVWVKWSVTPMWLTMRAMDLQSWPNFKP